MKRLGSVTYGREWVCAWSSKKGTWLPLCAARSSGTDTSHVPFVCVTEVVTPSSVPSKPSSATTPGGGGAAAAVNGGGGGGGRNWWTMSTSRSSNEYEPALSPTQNVTTTEWCWRYL